jgi:hypothetical protein
MPPPLGEEPGEATSRRPPRTVANRLIPVAVPGEGGMVVLPALRPDGPLFELGLRKLGAGLYWLIFGERVAEGAQVLTEAPPNLHAPATPSRLVRPSTWSSMRPLMRPISDPRFRQGRPSALAIQPSSSCLNSRPPARARREAGNRQASARAQRETIVTNVSWLAAL